MLGKQKGEGLRRSNGLVKKERRGPIIQSSYTTGPVGPALAQRAICPFSANQGDESVNWYVVHYTCWTKHIVGITEKSGPRDMSSAFFRRKGNEEVAQYFKGAKAQKRRCVIDKSLSWIFWCVEWFHTISTFVMYSRFDSIQTVSASAVCYHLLPRLQMWEAETSKHIDEQSQWYVLIRIVDSVTPICDYNRLYLNDLRRVSRSTAIHSLRFGQILGMPFRDDNIVIRAVLRQVLAQESSWSTSYATGKFSHWSVRIHDER